VMCAPAVHSVSESRTRPVTSSSSAAISKAMVLRRAAVATLYVLVRAEVSWPSVVPLRMRCRTPPVVGPRL
jgi:hypothetical protein